jgi:hypothetical protein
MVRLGDFHGGIGERATARIFVAIVLHQHIEQRLSLQTRVAGMRRDGFIPADPALTHLAAQILRHELVLRGEIAVETHLVGTGFGGDGIDAHGVNAVAIKEFAGRFHDAIAHARLWHGRNNLFLYSHLRRFSTTHKELHLTCD